MLNFIMYLCVIMAALWVYRNYRLWAFMRDMKRYNERRKRWIIGKNCFEASYRDGEYHV